ncbi:MAG: hypothetical protein QOI76_3019 [Frankiales bacterium]|jgi:hypothetical protein|nr:hypothetical protein [Frankiales bacterium]
MSHNLSELLAAAVPEPSYFLNPDKLLHDAQRRLARRRRGAAGICCVAVATVFAAAWLLLTGGQHQVSRSDVGGAPTSASTLTTSGPLSVLQGIEVAHVRSFIRAYNAGDLTSALTQFSSAQAVAFSDCDYSTQQLVDGHGLVALTTWLRQTYADHDHLAVGDIAVPAGDQHVLGVSFARRTSDSIARGGHPNGITPSTGAKLTFDNAGLITGYGNGPYGGPRDGCRLK